MNEIISKILKILNKPKIALLIIFLFILGFYLGEGLTGGFDKNFITFGPTQEKNGEYTTFMGIKVKSWKHVSIIYVIIFLSCLLSIYYNNVLDINLESFAFDHSVKKVPYTKVWTYLILLLDPLIQIILYIIRFYATFTLQLQYLVPQILATYLIEVPYILKWLSAKTFI